MSDPQPPIAPRRPFRHSYHGVELNDPYFWLQDSNYPQVDDPDVVAYLQAENAYFEAWYAPHATLTRTLFEELKARKPEQDESVPYEQNGWRYQWRFNAGDQYRVWLRQALNDAPDQWTTLLDENTLAAGREYFRLGALAVSPDGSKLAYSTDINGSERFVLQVMVIDSKTELTAPIENCAGSVVWNAASDGFAYRLVNEQWRPDKALYRNLGNGSDTLIYEEQDEAFFVSLGLSQSEQLMFISCGDHVTSEVRMVPRANLLTAPSLIEARREGHEYAVDHQGDTPTSGRLLVRSNRRHANFDLFETAIDQPNEQHWQALLSGDDTHYLMDHVAFADAIVVCLRINGLDQIQILSATGTQQINFPEPAYSLDLGTNPNYHSQSLRIAYTSMVTPQTVFDYHWQTDSLETLKVQEIPGGFKPSDYISQRLEVEARDGSMVPMSVVRHKNTPVDGTAPVYLYGYGAYGHAIPPSFSSNVLSLLQRGFSFAIAHIRGGDDLGYHWYTSGKLGQRTNTFNDFVDCAKHLIDTGHTQAGKIAIGGGSAGGELMGAVINQAPQLFGAVAAHVPFVDVLTTMLNPDLPLTPMEWPEWGNPIADAEAFDYIRSYSPVDQVSAKDYPPMLVTAGLNDPRVTYWEPAKWVAKLRYCKTDNNILLLKTNMGAGHGGQSGRFTALQELAEEYAFFLLHLAPDQD
ncbi:MAG: prolyl oligopeptidase family serine peptidase [Proteobacteria bacterium]|nr:prolyl oligopeptidase family serine peptidase [Pseudomonadota bacterium]